MNRGNRVLTALPLAGAVLFLAGAGAIIGPKVTHAARQSNEALLCESLRYLRTEIRVYAEEHQNASLGYAPADQQTGVASAQDEISPPQAEASADVLVNQLTEFTDTAGHVQPDRTASCNRGPYMISIPQNPMTLKSAIWVVDQSVMPKPDESQPFGWIYNAQTKQIIANVAGADSTGVPYAKY